MCIYEYYIIIITKNIRGWIFFFMNSKLQSLQDIWGDFSARKVNFCGESFKKTYCVLLLHLFSYHYNDKKKRYFAVARQTERKFLFNKNVKCVHIRHKQGLELNVQGNQKTCHVYQTSCFFVIYKRHLIYNTKIIFAS